MTSPFGERELATMCEVFQSTVAKYRDKPALRTGGGGLQLTWGEYDARMRRVAAGLASLGVDRGDTVALMMINRPEFHVCDAAVMHLGGTPFSIYNTLPAEQIHHLFSNAQNRVVLCQAQFAPRIQEAAAGTDVEQVI